MKYLLLSVCFLGLGALAYADVPSPQLSLNLSNNAAIDQIANSLHTNLEAGMGTGNTVKSGSAYFSCTKKEGEAHYACAVTVNPSGPTPSSVKKK